MMVLDTHVWLWWVSGDLASLTPARAALIEVCDEVAVSAMSCFEVAWLAHHGRIALPCDIELWLEKALDGSGILLLPMTPRVVRLAVELPEHHRDPQDRVIIATALAHDAKLMSLDSKFPLYAELAGRLV